VGRKTVVVSAAMRDCFCTINEEWLFYLPCLGAFLLTGFPRTDGNITETQARSLLSNKLST
jgi:hypothetical protein